MSVVSHEHKYTPRFAGEFKRDEADEIEKCSRPIRIRIGWLLWEIGKEHKQRIPSGCRDIGER